MARAAYWRILIQPNRYLPGHFRSPGECEAFVRYRFVPALGNESLPIVTDATNFHTSSAPAGVRGETDHPQLPALREAWALFQSAQFVLSRPLPVNRPSTKVIHYLELLRVVTQAFEFARRLAVERGIDGSVALRISLVNILGHEIHVPGRTVLTYCKQDKIEEDEEFSSLDGPDVVFERAIALVIRVCQQFGWREVAEQDLRREQQRQRL